MGRRARRRDHGRGPHRSPPAPLRHRQHPRQQLPDESAPGPPSPRPRRASPGRRLVINRQPPGLGARPVSASGRSAPYGRHRSPTATLRTPNTATTDAEQVGHSQLPGVRRFQLPLRWSSETATSSHYSDCAVYNEPAYPAEPCGRAGLRPARSFRRLRRQRTRRSAHLYLLRVESGGSMREKESASSRRGCGSCGKPACRFSKGLRETVRRFPRHRQLAQPRPPAGCVSGLPELHKEGRQAARSNRPRTVLRAPLWDLCPGCFAALDAQWRVRAIEHQYRYWQATRRADPSRLTQQKGGRDG